MPKTILIIEDELDTAKLLVKRLRDEGFEVRVAADAYQGTALTQALKPDLIVLDLMLPAGGGFSVLKNIHNIPTLSYIPVVILTGISDEEYKKKVLDEGVEAYIEKPYDHNVLISTIQNILKDRRP
jgi:DNA-binding response OmpR family regulator